MQISDRRGLPRTRSCGPFYDELTFVLLLIMQGRIDGYACGEALFMFLLRGGFWVWATAVLRCEGELRADGVWYRRGCDLEEAVCLSGCGREPNTAGLIPSELVLLGIAFRDARFMWAG